MFLFFFFNDTATTEIYTLSLHDALPISFQENEVLILEELPRPDSHQLGGLFEQALGGGKRNGDLPSQLFFEEFTRSLCFRARERLGGGHSFPPVRSPSAECPGVRCFGEVYRSSVILLKRFDRVAGTWSY